MANGKLRRCVKAVMYFYVPDKDDDFDYWWNKFPGTIQLFDESGKKMGKNVPFGDLDSPIKSIIKAKNRLYKLHCMK